MNREEVLAAARRNGDVLMTEGKPFDADLESVLAAVQSSVDALLWADPALRENRGESVPPPASGESVPPPASAPKGVAVGASSGDGHETRQGCFHGRRRPVLRRPA